MKQIGIIGSGAVGIALAKGFIKHGYSVKIGTNSAEKHVMLREKIGADIEIGNFENVAATCETIVLAVKGHAAQEALASCGAANLSGKTIIDTTNPIEEGAVDNGVLRFYTNLNHSQMELLQEAYPTCDFVKCFSCVGSALMVEPDFDGEKPTMFICGNSMDAKFKVTDYLTQFGWETEDMGAATAARAIEPLCILWCIPGFQRNQWRHAFKLLK